MEDILSQEEIDLLIRTSQNPQEESIPDDTDSDSNILYDFRKPNKFSKDQIRALQRIHDQFCRTYSGLMSAKLRSHLELCVNNIEQLTFGEFMRSLPNPSVISILRSSELDGSLVIQLTPDIAFILHDRLCGGPGNPSHRSRGLSDIELAVLRRQIFQVLCQLLGDAWNEVIDTTFQLESIESNPQFLQVAGDRDVAILLSLSFEFNKVQDMINICIPYLTLEPIMKQLTQHRLFDSLRQPDPEKLKKLKKKVRSAILPVEVDLGTAIVTAEDLLNLEIGDVIPLDRNRAANVDVKIGQLTKFKGTPGKLGNHLGVVITSICDPQGDVNNE